MRAAVGNRLVRHGLGGSRPGEKIVFKQNVRTIFEFDAKRRAPVNDNAGCFQSSSSAICSTRSTMRLRNLLFLMRMKDLVSDSPSEVARKSAT